MKPFGYCPFKYVVAAYKIVIGLSSEPNDITCELTRFLCELMVVIKKPAYRRFNIFPTSNSVALVSLIRTNTFGHLAK